MSGRTDTTGTHRCGINSRVPTSGGAFMSRLRLSSWLLAGLVVGLLPLARADVKYQPDEIAMYVGDARFWEKWDDYPFDREPCGREGFYGYFQMGKMLISSPERATIGDDTIFRQGFYGTIGSMTEYNSYET